MFQPTMQGFDDRRRASSDPLRYPFTRSVSSGTLTAMKTISIKELHDKTGHWLRRVKAEGEVVVTEGGSPVARMLPPVAPAAGNPFAKRKLLRGVARLIERPIEGADSAAIISGMREGR